MFADVGTWLAVLADQAPMVLALFVAYNILYQLWNEAARAAERDRIMGRAMSRIPPVEAGIVAENTGQKRGKAGKAGRCPYCGHNRPTDGDCRYCGAPSDH